ncbi:hypothetical protein Q7P35_006702 [Cladosporium inversicolor]
MEFQLRPTEPSTPDLGMDFGWQPDVYNKFIGNSNYAMDSQPTGMHVVPDQLNATPNFAEEISFKPAMPFTPEYGIGNTMDSTSLWPASMDQPDLINTPPLQAPVQLGNTLEMQRSSLSCSPMTITQRRSIAEAPRSSMITSASTPASFTSYERPLFAQASTPATTVSDYPISSSPVESEKTRRARYAANQRHSKAKQARKDSALGESTSVTGARAAERKQRHREKNKVAAAKCRSRQRKQVQTIQDKGSRLEEKILQLKTMIQELRGELNYLRSMALEHQECACPVARYNHDQAEKVVAEYRSACQGQGIGGLGRSPGFSTH